jgi:hypothetical protein
MFSLRIFIYIMLLMVFIYNIILRIFIYNIILRIFICNIILLILILRISIHNIILCIFLFMILCCVFSFIKTHPGTRGQSRLIFDDRDIAKTHMYTFYKKYTSLCYVYVIIQCIYAQMTAHPVLF